MSALKPKTPQNMSQFTQPSIVKTSLAVDKGVNISLIIINHLSTRHRMKGGNNLSYGKFYQIFYNQYFTTKTLDNSKEILNSLQNVSLNVLRVAENKIYFTDFQKSSGTLLIILFV